EEVVSLHVAVIIRARHIRRIQIHEVDAGGVEAEYIRALYGMPLAIIKHYVIEHRDLFREVFLDAQSKITPSIVIVRQVPRNRKHPPRLFLQARADQSRLSQGSLVW